MPFLCTVLWHRSLANSLQLLCVFWNERSSNKSEISAWDSAWYFRHILAKVKKENVVFGCQCMRDQPFHVTGWCTADCSQTTENWERAGERSEEDCDRAKWLSRNGTVGRTENVRVSNKDRVKRTVNGFGTNHQSFHPPPPFSTSRSGVFRVPKLMPPLLRGQNVASHALPAAINSVLLLFPFYDVTQLRCFPILFKHYVHQVSQSDFVISLSFVVSQFSPNIMCIMAASQTLWFHLASLLPNYLQTLCASWQPVRFCDFT